MLKGSKSPDMIRLIIQKPKVEEKRCQRIRQRDAMCQKIHKTVGKCKRSIAS
jgi:hypothetical protein